MWTWKDALVLAGAYLPVSLLGALLSQILPKGAGGVAGRPLLSQFIVYLLLVVVVIALAKITANEPARSLGLTFKWIPLALVAGPALAIVLGFLASLMKAPSLDTQVKDWLADPASLPYVALFIVVLAPIVEELIFRGFLQPLAIASAGPWIGIGGIALAFALLHGPTYKWTWQYLVTMALAGAAFGTLRHRSGSTVASTALHASYNATMLYAYLRP